MKGMILAAGILQLTLTISFPSLLACEMLMLCSGGLLLLLLLVLVMMMPV